MNVTIDDLMREAMREARRRHRFRPRRQDEPEAAYRAALADVVEHGDFALAHELRLGKRQADWTPEEVDAFSERFVAAGRAAMASGARRLVRMEAVTDPGPYPVSDEAMLAWARLGNRYLVHQRTQSPTAELAVFVDVLLVTGAKLTTVVNSNDRIAAIKGLAKSQPVFGYAVTADAWMHSISKDTHVATKHDVILTQTGTRTMRHMLRHPYAVVNGVARFDDLIDLDLRDPSTFEGGEMEDPYADVFVSVPRSERVQ